MDKRSEIIKRVFDIVASVSLLLLLAPVLLLCAFLVWASDGRPIFFHHKRDGRFGTAFDMWKFRTMRVDAEQILPRWLAEHPEQAKQWHEFRRIENDPRVIPGIGHLLRRASLDELPQLWNVLRGDMSLVGPRPMEVPVATRFSREVLELRRSVRPGLTGVWQVAGRSDMDVNIPAMIEMDDRYVQNWSLGKDVRLLLRTPAAVITKSSELKLTPA